jgi:hypothetical protein
LILHLHPWHDVAVGKPVQRPPSRPGSPKENKHDAVCEIGRTVGLASLRVISRVGS